MKAKLFLFCVRRVISIINDFHQNQLLNLLDLEVIKQYFFLASPDFFNIFGEDMPIARVRKEAEVKTRKQLTKRLEYHTSGGVTETLPVNEIIYNPGRSLEVMLSFLEENLQKESIS